MFVSAMGAAVLCLIPCAPGAGAADEPGTASPGTNEISAAPARLGHSPVDTFRKLLAMPAEERMDHLKMYPPPLHERMIAKFEEYQLLPEPLRELRLQVTELRWYLLPLLKVQPANRPAQVEAIPEPYRTWVNARLDQWDIMPPSLKDEMLEYESLLDRFVRGSVEAPLLPPNADDDSEIQRRMQRWQSLHPAQRQQIYRSLRRYLDLSDEEREKTLAALSEPEREETARVLEPMEQWSRVQQEQYLAAFRQFADMSVDERQQFLRNAQRWQKMSAAERQAWRDLAKQLAESPPAPLDAAPRGAGTGAATSSRTNPVAAQQR